MNPEEPAVRLENVTKSFNGRKVLDGISLEVPAGTGFCLLGRSGTGKSVTLRHIIGLMKPDCDRCWCFGHDVTALGRQKLVDVRRRMGFLFQNAALFDSVSVGENVASRCAATPGGRAERSMRWRPRSWPTSDLQATSTRCRRSSPEA